MFNQSISRRVPADRIVFRIGSIQGRIWALGEREMSEDVGRDNHAEDLKPIEPGRWVSSRLVVAVIVASF